MKLGLRLVGSAVFACCISLCLFAQPAAVSSEVSQRIERVIAGLTPAVVLKSDPHPAHSLSDRMAKFHVPGISIAVVHHGASDWARGFGVTSLGGPPVTAETMFQAGSISKPVAAMAALRLVEQGKISLDADVNTKLVSWKIPASPVAQGQPVTLRQLLTHTAGMTVHGFPGYATFSPVPSLVQVLNGAKPANTPAVRVETTPGTKWNYSGGGYTIMQQLLLDVSKEPFPKLLQDTVLGPIGMTHSTYQQPLPAALQASAAIPYDDNGKPVAGGAHTYPEMAAAGLWTTPSDLARYAMEIETSLLGRSNHVLSRSMAENMLTAGLGKWGLGLQIGGSSANPYFSHGGVNEGFESLLLAYRNSGEGAVVMTNARGGSLLASEVMRSIAAEYGWPDYRSLVKTATEVDPKILATYVGSFELRPNLNLEITLEGSRLTVKPTGQPEFPLFAESDSKFFPLVLDAWLEFFKDDQSKVTRLVWHQGDQEIAAPKK